MARRCGILVQDIATVVTSEGMGFGVQRNPRSAEAHVQIRPQPIFTGSVREPCERRLHVLDFLVAPIRSAQSAFTHPEFVRNCLDLVSAIILSPSGGLGDDTHASDNETWEKRPR